MPISSDCLINGVDEATLIEGVYEDSEATFSLCSPSTSRAECKRTTPSVSVPVLSEQRTFMLPKFSIEASLLTITFSLAMSLAPWARLILIIAGE